MGAELDLDDLAHGYPHAMEELRRLREDAERYRWLRTQHASNLPS